MKNFFKVLIISIFMSSCGIYSFTGASISSNIKTVKVDLFQNIAPIVNPRLSQDFTQSLQDLLLTRTNLILVEDNGDLVFEGEITNYSQTSVALTTSVASQVRFTIDINVRFYNNKEEGQDFEKKFTHYEDIESSGLISGAVEQELVELIIERILEQIFNESIANW